jgi:TonB family protein
MTRRSDSPTSRGNLVGFCLILSILYHGGLIWLTRGCSVRSNAAEVTPPEPGGVRGQAVTRMIVVAPPQQDPSAQKRTQTARDPEPRQPRELDVTRASHDRDQPALPDAPTIEPATPSPREMTPPDSTVPDLAPSTPPQPTESPRSEPPAPPTRAAVEQVVQVGPDRSRPVEPAPSPPTRNQDRTPSVSAPVNRGVQIDREALAGLQPDYPRLMRQRGIEDKVGVRFYVLTDGRISRLHFSQPSDHDAFNDAIRSAVRTARLEPARESGRPVPAWTGTIWFQFRLE